MKNKIKAIEIFSAIALFFLTTKSALAVCPICTVAVVGGVGLSRWLGIDDTISGVWIGGLIVSLSLWSHDWLTKKNINIRGQKPLLFLTYIVFIMVPFIVSDIVGNHFNKLFGMDKLILGMVCGAVFFYLGSFVYNKIKEKRGKAHFPFEKIVMPIAPLIILSVVFYFITKG